MINFYNQPTKNKKIFPSFCFGLQISHGSESNVNIRFMNRFKCKLFHFNFKTVGFLLF